MAADGNVNISISLFSFTAADVMVGYSVFWLSLINEGRLMKDTPNVQRYLARLKCRPMWKKCMENPDVTDPDWVAITKRKDENKD